jgi:hypothetical protein
VQINLWLKFYASQRVLLPVTSYNSFQNHDINVTPSKTMTSTAIIEMGDAWDLGFTDELWNNTT